jgi:AcrR family transcriptional regulator
MPFAPNRTTLGAVTQVQTLSRRPEAPTEKRQATETAVLTAMEELLGEGTPYAALSVERIATRAGISRTAFYFYFADKRELLMRLASELSDELYDEADAWWSGAGDGSQQLTAAVAKIATLYRAHRPLVCAIVEVAAYDEVVGPFWRALVDRFVQASAQRIATEIEAGRADAALVPEAISFSLVWMTERALYQMLVQDSPVCDDALVSALARIWTTTVYS